MEGCRLQAAIDHILTAFGTTVSPAPQILDLLRQFPAFWPSLAGSPAIHTVCERRSIAMISCPGNI